MKDPLVPDVETTAPLHPPAQQESCDSFSVALRLPTNLDDCNGPLFVHTKQRHARGTDLELLQAFTAVNTTSLEKSLQIFRDTIIIWPNKFACCLVSSAMSG